MNDHLPIIILSLCLATSTTTLAIMFLYWKHRVSVDIRLPSIGDARVARAPDGGYYVIQIFGYTTGRHEWIKLPGDYPTYRSAIESDMMNTVRKAKRNDRKQPLSDTALPRP